MLTLTQACRDMKVNKRTLLRWIVQGLLAGERRPTPGQARPMWFVKPGQQKPNLKRGRKPSK